MADVAELINRSVHSKTDETNSATTILFNIATIADEIGEWGIGPASRDAMLRKFYKSESILLSTVGVVAERDAGFEWKLQGPDRMVKIAHQMLNKVNFGKGMRNFIIQWDIDRLTQDKGAFTEIIRADATDPNSVCIGLSNLDAAKCMLTGNPLYPVIYTDAQGTLHKLPYWRVWHSTDLPTSEEARNGMQICAVSRVLSMAQLRRDIVQTDKEKASGQFQKALHIIGGIDQSETQTALDQTKQNAQQAGLTRYSQPAMVFAHRPDAKISHEVIEFASMPDGFDREKYVKEYITVIAMGFQTDYQELAPLPGGNIGTGAQSETLDKKSKAKGPANFRKDYAHMMNNAGIIPPSVEFSWEIDDADEDKTRADTSKAIGDAIAVNITSGILDKRSGLQILLDKGEISQEVYDYNVKRIEKEERDAAKAERDAAQQAPAAGGAPDDSEMNTQQSSGDENPKAGPNTADGKIDANHVSITGAQKAWGYLPKVSARR
jgi:hypothetical protein